MNAKTKTAKPQSKTLNLKASNDSNTEIADVVVGYDARMNSIKPLWILATRSGQKEHQFTCYHSRLRSNEVYAVLRITRDKTVEGPKGVSLSMCTEDGTPISLRSVPTVHHEFHPSVRQMMNTICQDKDCFRYRSDVVDILSKREVEPVRKTYSTKNDNKMRMRFNSQEDLEKYASNLFGEQFQAQSSKRK